MSCSRDTKGDKHSKHGKKNDENGRARHLPWHHGEARPGVRARVIACIYCTFPTEAGRTITVKIGCAPRLAVLGYLDTANHELEIGNTVIKAGVMKVSPTTVVPSVKVFALKVRFRVAEEVRNLLSFLRCFPEVETLHIMASDNDTDQLPPLKPTWASSGDISD